MGVNPNQYQCPIIGMAPNWDTPVKTTFCWKTAIAESLDGYEKRIACRPRPLIKTKFKVTNVDERRSSYIRKLMESRGETAVGVPVWMDSCHTLAPAETIDGSVILKVNARSRLFPWFKFALLWSDDLDYEVVEIERISAASASVTSDHVILVAMPSRHHEDNSILVPLAFGKLQIPDSRFYTNAVSEIDIDFEEKLGWIGSETGSIIEGPKTYESGRFISGNSFLLEPNWEGKPIQGLIDDIDYEPLDRGRSLPRTMSTAKRRTFGFSYLVTRYELQSVLKFFEVHDGRRGSFRIPTWTNDYTTTQDVTIKAADSQGPDLDIAIPIKRTGLSSMPVNYSALYKLDGDTQTLFTGTTVREGCTEIFIPDPPGGRNPIHIPAGSTLSGAAKVRLEDDEIEITSASPNAHTFELTFIETPHDGVNDTFQESITNIGYKQTWIYKIHRGSESRYFIDWPIQTDISGMEGVTRAQAADIHHNGVELTEDSLAKEVEIEVAGDAADYLLEDMESPVDVTIYSAYLDGYNKAHPTLFYEGRIESFDISDRILHATLSSTLRVLNNNAPNIVVQRKCNHIFCSSNCGIDKQSTLRRGTCDITVPTILSGNFTVEKVEFNVHEEKADSFWAGAKIIIAYGNEAEIRDGFPEFYSGIVTRVYRNANNDLCFDFCGEGDARYAIGDDAKPVGSETAGINNFTLYPVCSRTIGSCATFGNTVNFCGFPWLPNNNPLSSLQIDYDARGKK